MKSSFTMTPEPQSETDAVIHQLAILIMTRENMMQQVKRKRTMRESEKIMTLSDYKQQINALQFAINHIKGVIKP